jgi:hypothetical protein
MARLFSEFISDWIQGQLNEIDRDYKMKLNDMPRILWFDMEISPLKAYVWQLGKQVVRHSQLDKDFNQWGIICITYCWNDGKPAQCIDWGYEEQDTAKVVREFDEIIKQADHVIGKNNMRFDNKMLNAARMLNGLPGIPDWVRYTDDLERQMRKYFRLPSQSLDYISEQMGLGGKIKMEFQDWIDIVEKNGNGRKSFNKMIKYGKKDVEDTRTLWNKLSEHFEPKFNSATFYDKSLACINCASSNLKKNGTRVSGGIKYQTYICNDCARYAGRVSINREDRLK